MFSGRNGERYEEWKIDDLPIFPDPFQLKILENGRKQFDIVSVICGYSERCRETKRRKNSEQKVQENQSGGRGEMSIIKASTIRDDFLRKPPNGMPIILQSPSSRVLRKIKEAEYKEISLNQALAEMLIEIPVGNRPDAVTGKLQSLLMEQGPAVMIKDFEMLFDPRYQLDVLKLFCDLSRQQRIAVLWCGTFRENRLEFAEPGFADFQSYNIDQYTLYCVQ